jgi:hypothetical protein
VPGGAGVTFAPAGAGGRPAEGCAGAAWDVGLGPGTASKPLQWGQTTRLPAAEAGASSGLPQTGQDSLILSTPLLPSRQVAVGLRGVDIDGSFRT